MTSWTRDTRQFENSDKVYETYIREAGIKKIQHMGLTFFGDAKDDLFLRNIRIMKHSYAVGDTLSKISYKYYGDSRYWWVLAWFNGKPLDFHCKIGDNIVVPMPLQDALMQARNRTQEV